MSGEGLASTGFAALVIVSTQVIAALFLSPLLDGPAARGRQDAGAPRVAEAMSKADFAYGGGCVSVLP